MSAIKHLIDEIINCDTCEGSGIMNEWVSQDGDYDFEWCDCNPEHLVPDGDF
jgi:hypothetical protein